MQGALSAISSMLQIEILHVMVKVILCENKIFVALRLPESRENAVYIFGIYKKFDEKEVEALAEKIYHLFLQFCDSKTGLSRTSYSGNKHDFDGLTEFVKENLIF